MWSWRERRNCRNIRTVTSEHQIDGVLAVAIHEVVQIISHARVVAISERTHLGAFASSSEICFQRAGASIQHAHCIGVVAPQVFVDLFELLVRSFKYIPALQHIVFAEGCSAKDKKNGELNVREAYIQVIPMSMLLRAKSD